MTKRTLEEQARIETLREVREMIVARKEGLQDGTYGERDLIAYRAIVSRKPCYRCGKHNEIVSARFF
jgi:hypothetical protein